MGAVLAQMGPSLSSAIHLQLAMTFSNTTHFSTLRLDHVSGHITIHLRLDVQQVLAHISYSDDVDMISRLHHSFEYSSQNPIPSQT
jgi:hypothetical protein